MFLSMLFNHWTKKEGGREGYVEGRGQGDRRLHQPLSLKLKLKLTKHSPT